MKKAKAEMLINCPPSTVPPSPTSVDAWKDALSWLPQDPMSLDRGGGARGAGLSDGNSIFTGTLKKGVPTWDSDHF